MKKMLLFLLIHSFVFSQDFSSIKEKTDTYAGLITSEKLAQNINRDFAKKEDKVKAVFAWITRNIRYDLKEFYNPNRKKSYSFSYQNLEELKAKKDAMYDSIVNKTLSTRRGVCEGFARTFAKVCTLLNIENEVVEGYVRSSSNEINSPILQPNHAWNAVKLNNKWLFIDATWASGYEYNRKWIRKFNPYYYNIPKTTFFKTHLPEKSLWKLQVGHIEKETFYKQPIYNQSFLKLNLKLISPTTGLIEKNNNGEISIQLKNINVNQKIRFGFLSSRFAQKPKVTSINGITTASILPPNNEKQVFLMIDGEVMLEFLIK